MKRKRDLSWFKVCVSKDGITGVSVADKKRLGNSLWRFCNRKIRLELETSYKVESLAQWKRNVRQFLILIRRYTFSLKRILGDKFNLFNSFTISNFYRVKWELSRGILILSGLNCLNRRFYFLQIYFSFIYVRGSRNLIVFKHFYLSG